jgi:hypothetical protein
MGCAGKARHVGADLRENGSRGARPRRRQGEQQLEGVFLLGHHSGDAHLHPMDRLLQVVEVIEHLVQQLPLMRLHPAGQGAPQGGQLLAQPPLGQLGQDRAVGFSLCNRPQHLPPAGPHHIAGDRPQLEVGRFQEFVDALDLLGTQLNERLALAGEIAQNADGRRAERAG